MAKKKMTARRLAEMLTDLAREVDPIRSAWENFPSEIKEKYIALCKLLLSRLDITEREAV